MKSLLFWVSGLLSVLPLIAHSAMWHQIEVFGKVESFNETSVSLKAYDKSVKIQKKLIVDSPPLKTGEWVRLTLDIDPNLPH